MNFMNFNSPNGFNPYLFYIDDDERTPEAFTTKYLSILFNVQLIREGKSLRQISNIGREKMAKMLHTNLENGIETLEQVDSNRIKFGANAMVESKKELSGFKRFFMECLDDNIYNVLFLIIITVCTIASNVGDGIVLSLMEGLKIIIFAVAILLLEAYNGYLVGGKLRTWNKRLYDKTCQVVRNGNTINLSITELVVGDLLKFKEGDILAADGIMISGQDVQMNEVRVYGDDSIKNKSSFTTQSSQDKQCPFLFSNSECIKGSGQMIVLAVGKHTSYGRYRKWCSHSEPYSYLQLEVKKIATSIREHGSTIAFYIFLIFLGYYGYDCYLGKFDFISSKTLEMLFEALMILLTIKIVSTKPALSFSVRISEAYSIDPISQYLCEVVTLEQVTRAGCLSEIFIDKSGLINSSGSESRDVAIINHLEENFIRKVEDLAIHVRMVNDDAPEIATALAIRCGILSSTKELGKFEVVDGKFFTEQMEGTDDQKKSVSSQMCRELKVLVNASLKDKCNLLKRFQSDNVTAIVTKDTTLLKKADIGFVLGLGANDRSRAAAGLILTENLFVSIFTVIGWGRMIHYGVRNFIQFELQLIISVLAIYLIGIMVLRVQLFNIIQMLWINKVLDAIITFSMMASTQLIAIEKPYREDRNLVSPIMKRNIIIGVIYQILAVGGLLFILPNGHYKNNSMCFQTFVLIQIFNQIYFKLQDIKLSKAFKLKIFWKAQMLELIMQLLLISCGEQIMKIESLSLQEHLICFGLGIGIIIFQIAVQKMFQKKEGKLKE